MNLFSYTKKLNGEKTKDYSWGFLVWHCEYS